MDVLEAIQARHSVRDFDAKTVSKEIVMQIMQAATCSPSSGNGQPWEIFIATGATLEKIRQDDFGGTPARRAWFVHLIVDRARQKLGSYPILIKMNCTERESQGGER